MVLHRHILRRLFWRPVLCIRFYRDRPNIVSAPRSVVCQRIISRVTISPKVGDAIGKVTGFQIDLMVLPTKMLTLSVQAVVLRIPNWMETPLWINEVVYCTRTLPGGRVYSSYPGVRLQNFVSAQLSSFSTFWFPQFSGHGRRLL